MLTFIASCIHMAFSGEIFVGSKSASKFINRDGLSKKQLSPSKQKNYYGDSFSSTKPLLKVKDVKASCIRVKVKMTKQEAARFLSKCKDGGVLEFRDVAHELLNLPMNRVSVVSRCPDSNNAMLDSIPEEY